MNARPNGDGASAAAGAVEFCYGIIRRLDAVPVGPISCGLADNLRAQQALHVGTTSALLSELPLDKPRNLECVAPRPSHRPLESASARLRQ